MQEVWKDVTGYEGLYQVSNLGRVKSLERDVPHGDSFMHVRGRVLVACPGKESYPIVMLSKDGKARPHRVHRLVAKEFIPNPEHRKCVDHIDGNKLNNSVENLRWCSHSENTKYAWDLGLMHATPYAQRSLESQMRYSMARKKQIVRSDGKHYACTADAANDLGVTYSAVSHVLRGLTQTCQGFGFTYA